MRVSAELNSYVAHSYSGEGSFADWSESYTTTLGTVRTLGEDEDVLYPADGYKIPDGSEYAYVLWIEYGTGDSFGSADGCGSILGVFGSREVANKAKAEFEKCSCEFSIEISDDFDRKIKMSNPAAGYFEHVESVHLDEVKL